MKRALIVVFALFAASQLGAAEAPAAVPAPASAKTLRLEEGASLPAAKIADLAWLSGYWQGEGLGGSCEEVWGKPAGDRMHGYFSLRNEKGHVFSEAMLLVEEGGSVVLKIKHFRPDFVGWEEKDEFVTFRLVRLGDREAFFHGLTFRRSADDTLAIYLRLVEGETAREEAFSFSRVAF